MCTSKALALAYNVAEVDRKKKLNQTKNTRQTN
jgi:hypothetical protein